MKKYLLPVAFALVVSCPIAPVLRAADAPPAHKEPETELGKTMEKLNGAWRKLRKQAAEPASNASSLELLATIRAGSEKALTLKPAKADDVPAADREKFVQAYQDQMKKLIAELGKLEAAFKANDNATAQELIKSIGALQKEGHKEYKRPDL